MTAVCGDLLNVEIKRIPFEDGSWSESREETIALRFALSKVSEGVYRSIRLSSQTSLL